MPTHTTLSSLFTDIADAIRGKTGGSETIIADNFPTAISAIPAGGQVDVYDNTMLNDTDTEIYNLEVELDGSYDHYCAYISMVYEREVMEYIKYQASTKRYVIGAQAMLPKLTLPDKSGGTNAVSTCTGYCYTGGSSGSTMIAAGAITTSQYPDMITISIGKESTSASSTYIIPPYALYYIRVFMWND